MVVSNINEKLDDVLKAFTTVCIVNKKTETEDYLSLCSDIISLINELKFVAPL